MRKYLVRYSNGYCGCDEAIVIEAESFEEAEKAAQDGLYDYSESYENVAHLDAFEGDEYDDEREWYYDNCTFVVEDYYEGWEES
jgi:hypothetical protein